MDVIITGCSRGIGFELSRIFATDSSCRVLAISRTMKGLSDLKKLFPNTLFPFQDDITSADFINHLYLRLDELHFAPSLLINNAGLLVNKGFESLTANNLDDMMNVNLKSPFLLIQALMPYFHKPAHIVNIGSMGGFQGSVKFPGLSLYSASKAALAALTECLAVELQGTDIHVNCLAIGSAQTEMLEEAFPGYVSPVSAREMATFIHQFALSGHRFFNGKVIPVSSTTP